MSHPCTEIGTPSHFVGMRKWMVRAARCRGWPGGGSLWYNLWRKWMKTGHWIMNIQLTHVIVLYCQSTTCSLRWRHPEELAEDWAGSRNWPGSEDRRLGSQWGRFCSRGPRLNFEVGWIPNVQTRTWSALICSCWFTSKSCVTRALIRCCDFPSDSKVWFVLLGAFGCQIDQIDSNSKGTTASSSKQIASGSFRREFVGLRSSRCGPPVGRSSTSFRPRNSVGWDQVGQTATWEDRRFQNAILTGPSSVTIVLSTSYLIDQPIAKPR